MSCLSKNKNVRETERQILGTPLERARARGSREHEEGGTRERRTYRGQPTPRTEQESGFIGPDITDNLKSLMPNLGRLRSHLELIAPDMC